jgi:hypothetical protein
MSDYPEHDKQTKVVEQTQAAGEFIEWLESKGIFLAHHVDGHNFPQPVYTQLLELLAEWAGIDLKKIEAEKRQMLAAIRKANEAA